jgi:hypothetical protein
VAKRSSLLERVADAAEAKRRSEEEFRAALLAARAEHSLAEIAAVAGISRQAVHKATRLRPQIAERAERGSNSR